jgi:heterodisulfide reductase subunit A
VKPLRGNKSKEPKIGVFLCSCDGTISKTIDFNALEKRLKDSHGVVLIRKHEKLCDMDGQNFIKNEVSSSEAERVVIAACTPRTHEDLLEKGAQDAGINKNLIELVNIREQCDWIHNSGELTTDKAETLIRGGVARVAYAQPGEEIDSHLVNNSDVLVIGGGVAGITSALDLLKKGYSVHLVERSDKLGGRAYELDGERLAEEGINLPNPGGLVENQNADIMLESEVTDITGTFGDYSVKVKNGEEEREVTVGAIVIATGSDLFDANRIPEYNFTDSDVIDFFELEKMLAEKEVKVPSTGEAPSRVNFIQCAGSRDENKGNAHCSLVCCTYAINQARRIKELSPDTDVLVHYMDLRGPDNGFEEKYIDAQSKGVNFMRGRVAEVLRNNGGLVLRTEHIELGDVMELPSDLVVLALGQEASRGTEKLVDMLHLVLDVDNFMGYYNLLYDIVDRRGISIAGNAQGPRGIERSMRDGKKSAYEVARILKNGFSAPRVHSVIDEERCVGCRICEQLCPYDAISMKVVKNFIKDETRLVSNVNLVVCQGCGACAMACPGGVPQLSGYSNKEILAQIDEVT